jgi:rhodanese-related sulfurtransferase
MNTSKTIILTIILSALVGSATTLAIVKSDNNKKPTNEELIAEFYNVENATHVSPHGLRGKLDKGGKDVLIVDLRSAEEYEKGHIVSAINIPAYKDPNTPAYEEVDRIVSQFKKAISENPNKEVITYCYSAACMTGRKVGKMLSDNGVFVKTLNIGWNEWKYFWTLWNHEHEWKSTKPENYIVVGKEPGTPTQRSLPSPCGDGELGC